MPNLIRRISSRFRRQEPEMPETKGRTITELHETIKNCQESKHAHGEETAWQALVNSLSQPTARENFVKENTELRKALATLKKSKLRKQEAANLLAELAGKYHDRWQTQRQEVLQAINEASEGYRDHHLHELDLEAIRFHIATGLRHRREGPVWNALHEGLSRPIPETLESENHLYAEALRADSIRTAKNLLDDENSALGEEEKTQYRRLFNALLSPRK